MRNHNRSLIALVGVMLLAFVATAGAASNTKKRVPNKPLPTDASLGFFDNTRAEFRASIKRVGMLPVRLPPWLEDRPDAEQALQDAVARYLKLAGLEVVGPDTYQATYDRFNKQLGGTFNSKTGLRKSDVARAVIQNARREFIDKEHLDGFVQVSVAQEAATFYGDTASWDGVRERCNGAGQGTLPAISLLVQIFTSQDRVAYGRFGGIQLVSYSIPAQGFTFARVPMNDLLRDTVRIDRAAREATLPLVHTPREIAYGVDNPEINAMRIKPKDLPPAPEAKKEVRESPLKVPRDQLLGTVKRVAMSPLYTGDFTVPEDVQKRFVDLVRAELAPLNWELVDSPKVRTVLLSKMLASELFDPFTGKRDEARIKEIRKSVFKELGTETPPDAIMWLRVIRTGALQRWGDVEWDGVDQNVFTRGPVVRKIWGGSANMNAGTGSVEASSFNVYIADVNDTELYHSQGGIELVQTLNLTLPTYYSAGKAEPVNLAPNELFRNPAREQPAVHAALRDLTMTPEALQVELNPLPQKKGKKTKKP